MFSIHNQLLLHLAKLNYLIGLQGRRPDQSVSYIYIHCFKHAIRGIFVQPHIELPGVAQFHPAVATAVTPA